MTILNFKLRLVKSIFFSLFTSHNVGRSFSCKECNVLDFLLKA